MAATKSSIVMMIISAVMMISVTAVVGAEEGGGEEAGCGKVVGPLQPCLDFLRGQGDMPSPACCNGAKELDANAKTTNEKQEACKCLKDAMTKIKNIDLKRIPEIPEKCKITTSLPPIGPDFDCSSIKSEFGGLLFNTY